MALIALSLILSIVFGSCAWLVVGDRFPLEEEEKYPAANNICIYSAILLIPVYLLIFFLHS